MTRMMRRMGTLSYFRWEKNISLNDRAFYEYLKLVATPGSPDAAIIEWYDTLGHPVTFQVPRRCARWRREVRNDMLRFSFACFNGWRLMGYDNPEFRKLMHAMEHFLAPERAPIGIAHFAVEGNRDFEFRIDYGRRRIAYVTSDDRSYRTWAPDKYRIRPSIMKRLAKANLDGIRTPPPRSFVEGPSLQELIGLKKPSRKPKSFWRIWMKDTAIVEQHGKAGDAGRIRASQFGQPRQARAHFYQAIKKRISTGMSEVSEPFVPDRT